jgi:hypothetical protein
VRGIGLKIESDFRVHSSESVLSRFMKSQSHPSQVEEAIPVRAASVETLERHFSISEISEIWNVSKDTVRRMFQDEPGVLILGRRPSRHKRGYTTLRIPQSVLERVHRKYSLCSKQMMT